MKLRWVDRFIIAAIIQGALITVMALVIVTIQMMNNQINIIQYLSLSFDGTAKWFFLGIIFHLIIIVAVAVTALFYSHLEITLGKKFTKKSNILAGIHLVGMNVGGAGAMMIMTYAGLAGTGLLSIFTEGKLGPKYPAIMDSFIEPIGGFIAFLAIGVVCGGIGFLIAYRNNEALEK
ncbi:hypothetical protein [Nitrosarchaeum koreense]|uniref:Uncharacterized protein n=1 Tax=Nitrosarchaeum koreense MY1 TaxID=1001994 RepID=F9CV21_9ARCH|nr:hypothetical protein [Nitrosarchaeum koreense]EGP93136.1 hypothetical protein MY1_0366 [Nitrosarchaeum koreense MY1]